MSSSSPHRRSLGFGFFSSPKSKPKPVSSPAHNDGDGSNEVEATIAEAVQVFPVLSPTRRRHHSMSAASAPLPPIVLAQMEPGRLSQVSTLSNRSSQSSRASESSTQSTGQTRRIQLVPKQMRTDGSRPNRSASLPSLEEPVAPIVQAIPVFPVSGRKSSKQQPNSPDKFLPVVREEDVC
ncbi:hypothetical protein BASA81_001538 [Batrachochytrium salamandrivorans]|nr:hypothetical protein BASA81_001538 [Batrachochytrium salamandrivorans]